MDPYFVVDSVFCAFDSAKWQPRCLPSTLYAWMLATRDGLLLVFDDIYRALQVILREM